MRHKHKHLTSGARHNAKKRKSKKEGSAFQRSVASKAETRLKKRK